MPSKFGGVAIEEEPQKSKYGGIPLEQPVPSTFSKVMGTLGEIAQFPMDIVGGQAKNIAGNVLGAVNLGAKLHNLTMPGKPIPPPVSRETMDKWTAPKSTGEQIGKTASEMAEFFLPGPAKLKTASKLVKAGFEGAKTGVITGLQTGDVGSAATAGGVGFGLSGAMQSIPGAANYLKGAAKNAIEWAESKGVPMTFGQRTGNLAISRTEQGLQNVIGASGPALKQSKLQEESLEKVGKDVINRTAPGLNLNEFETGQNVAARVQQIIASAKSQADKLYDDVRAFYRAGRKTVQVGTTTIVDPSTGKAIQSPVNKTFELSVDVAPSQAKLQPIFDELTKTMPEAKRQYSPGYQALKQFMEGPVTLDAVTADRNLSALKSILRTSGNPYLSTQSQRIAGQAVTELTQAFNRTLNASNPNILPTLTKARAAVTAQHVAADILNDLPTEPGQLYGLLIRPGDKTVESIRTLKKLAPDQVQQVGRTYLQGMWDKLTEGGAMSRGAGAFRDWQKMGPETKKLLFGSQTSDIDNFFMATKRLRTDFNPSGSAAVALASLGPIGAVLHTMFTPGTIEEKVRRGVVEIPLSFMGGNLLSRLLVTPGGARALTTVLNAPSQSEAFRSGVNGVASMVSRMFTSPATEIPPPPQ
jgi:hypothetical protein